MVTRFIALILILCSLGCGTKTQPLSTEVTIGGETFNLEIVRDVQSRAKGLMHRTEIQSGRGMIFVFPDAIIRSFWMKNCIVPIDLIFLDSRGTITATHEMAVEPPKNNEESEWDYDNRLSNYWSNAPTRFAIELQSGSIKRLNVKINDRIHLDLKQLRSLAR
jgi:hypothetical protein